MSETLAVERMSPRWIARAMLLISLLSVWFVDFGVIRSMHLAVPGMGMDVLRGNANAPEQYRVGVVWLAYWMARHLPLGLHYCFALIDGASLLLAGFVLLRVLERTATHKCASVTTQWFGIAAFVVLMQFYLLWLTMFWRAETLPSVLSLAWMLWLWQMEPAHSAAKRSLIVAGLLSVSVIQSFVRADVACLASVGFFVTALTFAGKRLSLPRALALTTSFAGAVVAGGIQFYLAKVAYPQASYGVVKMWQLRPNMVHTTRWPPFVLFVLPVIWMTVQVVRRRFAEDGAGVAMLVAAGIYATLWITIGKIDEVRIFLPFTLALAPLTVEMVMLKAETRYS